MWLRTWRVDTTVVGFHLYIICIVLQGTSNSLNPSRRWSNDIMSFGWLFPVSNLLESYSNNFIVGVKASALMFDPS